MKRLTTLAAAVLLAAGAQAQTAPTTTPMPPSAGTNPTMPAEVTPGSAAAQPPASDATTAPSDATSTSGTGSPSPQQELKHERQASATEMKRLSREGAQAQRDAARMGGEMSTPQQDRGGSAGLGDESQPPLR